MSAATESSSRRAATTDRPAETTGGPAPAQPDLAPPPEAAPAQPDLAPPPERAAAPEPATQQEPSVGPAAGPRIYTGQLIGLVSAVMLLVVMFALDWYGVVGLPRHARRSGITTAEDAWRVLTDLRWLMLLTIVIALGAVTLHVSQRSHGTKTDTSLIVTGFGTLTAALVGYRVLIDLPNSSSVVDVKLGAYLGLVFAIGIAIGGYESMRQGRERRRSLVPKRRARSPVESRPEAR